MINNTDTAVLTRTIPVQLIQQVNDYIDYSVKNMIINLFLILLT